DLPIAFLDLLGIITTSDKVVSRLFEIKLTGCNKERLISWLMRGSVTALNSHSKEISKIITTL
ncbi:hypothetical protein, partial [Klebsiella pneumoniae]|uniref:hypothetical protein n=1 Tax=Klebsiella pneumoniae TaxID=573 RepID=UPI001D0EAE2E